MVEHRRFWFPLALSALFPGIVAAAMVLGGSSLDNPATSNPAFWIFLAIALLGGGVAAILYHAQWKARRFVVGALADAQSLGYIVEDASEWSNGVLAGLNNKLGPSFASRFNSLPAMERDVEGFVKQRMILLTNFLQELS